MICTFLSSSTQALPECNAKRVARPLDEPKPPSCEAKVAAKSKSSSAQPQTLRAVPVMLANDSLPKGIQFFCAERYEPRECTQHVASLEHMLASYPVELVVRWSFVLVSSEHWKELVDGLGGNSDSPAFSVLEQRTTVFEQALFSGGVSRRAELLRLYGSSGDALLKLAVSHEFGHAFCEDTSEKHADEYGRQLRAGKVPTCYLRKRPALASRVPLDKNEGIVKEQEFSHVPGHSE